MFKRIFGLITIIMLILTSTSCYQNNTKINSNDNNPNPIQENNSETQSNSNEIVTNKNYKINDEIEIGDRSNIIEKEGVFENKHFWSNEIWFVGGDKTGNIFTFNFKNNVIECIDTEYNKSTLLNIMGERKNYVYAIKKFGNIVAWSEGPHCDNPYEDETNGADWGLYFADLKTKKITKIDGDDKITVPQGTQYGYLCPNNVFISKGYISYISFDYNTDGKVTSVIKLYNISSGDLEIIDYLNEDLTKYAFGYPNISDDKMVWCKALVNPDGTYSGHSYLYDLKTKVKSKLVTDENIINPRINGNYIFAQGLPNITFYDSEVCIYDVNKNEWIYKINNGYSQYNMEKDVYLSNISTVGNYGFWYTGVNRSLVVFNKTDNKLYNIVQYSDNKEITMPMLLDGGLLIWFEKPWGAHDVLTPTFKYCILK